MVEIGYIPLARSLRLSRPFGKVPGKQRTAHEQEKEQRDKNAKSKNKANDTADNPHFDGYA
ncbi:MAG: hypothetical protein L3J89_12890 [Gammaproteobacteria bacterium]|nr:hypothetical protein [Gammaproteobacteria bacterium]